MKPLLTAVAVTVVFTFNQTTHARPPYVGAYNTVYPNEPIQCRKCSICHVSGVKDKKQRNRYGKAIRKALPHPNVKDKETVIKAIKAAEKFKPKPCTSFRNWLIDRNTQSKRSERVAGVDQREPPDASR